MMFCVVKVGIELLELQFNKLISIVQSFITMGSFHCKVNNVRSILDSGENLSHGANLLRSVS